ncbi:MAG: hypothetical protein HQM03_11550 [Magnetococcales bacterium]|nr:hypothetical protein [Magnetococcales bacterium]
MILPDDLLETIVDANGRERLAVRATVPARVLRVLGLLMTESEADDADAVATPIPIQALQGVTERCVFTAGFGAMTPDAHFASPLQLATIPCRSATSQGHCNRTGRERHCPLQGLPVFVETPEKERVTLLVAPVPPGEELTQERMATLAHKREEWLLALRQREELFTPVTFLLDASNRGMQFWLKAWFG